MTLDLHNRFEGAHGLIELECREDDCDGRMLVDSGLANRLGIECPIPTCDGGVRVA